jgi:UPF0716 protein FxsA
VPAVELALLIEAGGRIGTAATLAIIVATGVVGAALANQQGLRTLRAIQASLEQGRLPAGALVDGVIILVAGALLVTPGILTDAVGFLCLVPALRAVVRRALQRRFERAVAEQRIHVVGGAFDATGMRGPIYDVTPPRRTQDEAADEDADDAPPPRLH